jgi:hypothetical protein
VPVAAHASRRLPSLPMHTAMRDADVDDGCSSRRALRVTSPPESRRYAGRPMTRARFVARLALMLMPALAAAAAPAGVQDGSYLPLGPGARWEYEVHRDHSYRPAVGPVDRTFRKGSLVREYVSARDGALHELLERSVETPISAGGLPPSRELERQLWSTSAGVRLHGIHPDGGVEIRFASPLHMLPAAPEPGARWTVGRWRRNGVEALLEAEAIGYEDVVDGAERWEGCLEVRYTGQVSGTIPVAQGPATLREGRLERVVWWKRGVGPVREVTTYDAGLVLPDGSAARIHEVVTVRLVRRQAPE